MIYFNNKRVATVLFLLSLIGIAISIYSVAHFFGITSGSICNINEVLNCDLVNKSVYAKIGGIPVSIVGLIGYLFLAIASYLKWKEKEIDRGLTQFLLTAIVIGFFFSLYLTGVEAFILKAFCPTCLISQVTTLLMTIFIVMLYVRERHL
ncbi:MAG: vitamin K epoxide reductase family protein [Patescibacteria group bacterium]